MRIFTLVLLSLSLHLIASQIVGGYSQVTPEEVDNDLSIQSLLIFGASYVVQQGVSVEDLPYSEYDVTYIYGVYRQVVSGINYRFDVELTNAEGISVRVSYVVYRSLVNTREVTEFSYDIIEKPNEWIFDEYEFTPEEVYFSLEEEGEFIENEEDVIVGGFTKQDITDIELNVELTAIMNFGIQYIIEQETQASRIPSVDYEVLQVLSLYTQVVAGINYRFDLELGNQQGLETSVRLRVTFVVYQSLEEVNEVTSYAYDLPESDETEAELEEFVLPEEENLLGGYSMIDISKLDVNKDLRDALDFGVRNIVNTGVLNHRLPDSKYEVTQIFSIFGQVVSGMNYRFNVELTNCAGLVLRAVFTIYQQVWTKTIQFTEGAFDITSIPEEGLIGENCPSEVIQEEENVVVILEEETPGHRIVGGFGRRNITDIEENDELRAIMNFGIQYIIEQETKASRIPSVDYEVLQVFSLYTQLVSGMNYRFDLELGDQQGLETSVRLRVTFVVYQTLNEVNKVTSYAYDLYASDETEAELEEFVLPEEENLLGGYSMIDISELDVNKDLRDALDFGVRNIVNTGVLNHRLPDSKYEVTQIFSIFGQVVSGMNYRFNVELTNCAGLVLRAVFTIYQQVWTKTIQFTEGAFEITKIPEEGLIRGICPPRTFYV